MLKRLTPRWIIIILVVSIAGFLLYPTIRFERLSEAERNQMEQQGTLDELKAKIIKRGLDLQGGMHLVLEVDVPRLVSNLAKNKTPNFEQVFSQAQQALPNSEESFLTLFEQYADQANLRLVRYFPDRGITNEEVIASIEDDANDAVQRALEIIRNRVDQFGVSEPDRKSVV